MLPRGPLELPRRSPLCVPCPVFPLHSSPSLYPVTQPDILISSSPQHATIQSSTRLVDSASKVLLWNSSAPLHLLGSQPSSCHHCGLSPGQLKWSPCWSSCLHPAFRPIHSHRSCCLRWACCASPSKTLQSLPLPLGSSTSS